MRVLINCPGIRSKDCHRMSTHLVAIPKTSYLEKIRFNGSKFVFYVCDIKNRNASKIAKTSFIYTKTIFGFNCVAFIDLFCDSGAMLEHYRSLAQ